MQKYLPQMQILIGSLMVSFSAVFVRLTTVPPTVDGFYRMLIGGIILLTIAIIRKKTFWQGRQAFLYISLSALFFSLDIAFWHQSIDYLGPGLATIIVNLQVFILVFIGIVVFKERISKKFFLAIPIAVIGLYLLIADDWSTLGHNYRLGVLLCFIAMLNYSVYLLVLRKSQQLEKRLPTLSNMAVISLLSAAILGVIALCQSQSFVIPNITNGVWLMMYGLFGQVLGWLLISYGLPKTKLTLAGFLLLLQPACTFIWDILFFHRPTTMAELIGAIITIIAIYLSSTSRHG